MARPISISEERILEAARIVFVRDGLNATTRDIAREAGISEGSIFNRFPTKAALLAAAVEPPSVPGWVQRMQDLQGVGDVRENLIAIGREMVGFTQNRLPLLLVFLSSKRDHPTEPPGRETAAERDRRRLAGFLQQEIDAGRLRPFDTEAISQMLFGACVHYALDGGNRELSDADQARDRFVTGLIDAIWPSIAPEAVATLHREPSPVEQKANKHTL